VRAAIGLGLLVGLAGCLGVDGPGAYGDAQHPMKAYDTIGIAPPGQEERALASLKAALKRDGLWGEVKRAKSSKDILMIWATVRAHLRIIDLLEEMRRR
jgi:hypothetical protein